MRTEREKEVEIFEHLPYLCQSCQYDKKNMNYQGLTNHSKYHIHSLCI